MPRMPSTVVPNQPPAQVAVRGQVAPKIVRVDSFHIAGHIYAAHRLARIEVFLTLHAESFRAGFAPRVVVDKLFPDLTFFGQFSSHRYSCVAYLLLDIESYAEYCAN
jgi:hypothetical protein